MGTITKSVDVSVPVSMAYNQWTQFESFPEFMEGVDEVRQLNDTRLHWVTKVGGNTREFDATITEQHPDERVAWTSLEEPKHGGVVTFHRLDESNTRVHLEMEYEPQSIPEKAGAAMGVVQQRVKGDLKRFKEFIESRDAESGAWRGEIPRPSQTDPGPKET